MKLLLFALFGVVCFAQDPPAPVPIIPTHSVSGDSTVDISDVDVKTAYGTTETKAAVSVCVSRSYAMVQVQITGPTIEVSYQLAPVLKAVTNAGNCATVMAPVDRKGLVSIQVYLANLITIVPIKPAADAAMLQSTRAK